MFNCVPYPSYGTDRHDLMPLAHELLSLLSISDEPVVIRKASTPSSNSEQVHNIDKEFRICLELQHYQPEEVTITSNDHQVTVTAKHDMRQDDDNGLVSRQITRVCNLPKDIDPQSLTSTMNSQGMLIIRARKWALSATERLNYL